MGKPLDDILDRAINALQHIPISPQKHTALIKKHRQAKSLTKRKALGLELNALLRPYQPTLAGILLEVVNEAVEPAKTAPSMKGTGELARVGYVYDAGVPTCRSWDELWQSRSHLKPGKVLFKRNH